MSDRFAESVTDRRVRHDIRLLGDFTRIYCDGHHADLVRRPAVTGGTELVVHGPKPLLLCAECEEHLSYAEKRRAYCGKDPKPFCAHCDTHCYSADEAAWQREMMRYSGPKSWRYGHAIDGIRHMLEGRRAKRDLALSGRAEARRTTETAEAASESRSQGV